MSKTKLDNLGVSAFCESMAMMLHSSIQTDEAVGLLLEDNAPDAQQERKGSGVLEEGLKVMKQQVDEGLGLGVAMEESGIFPDYALKMVQAGEKSGHLENILFGLARYYKDQTTISAKIRNAVTYPAAMLVLIIVVLAAMLRLVLPAFTDVYDKLTGSLAASSYGYIRLAFVFCRAALIVMIVLAAGLLIGRRMWQGEGRAKVEALLSRVPLCREIFETMGMFRFTSALSTFIAAGEMEDDAVHASIPMTDCPAVEEKLRRCLKHMEEGRGLAQAAYKENLFEPVYGRMLLAGERSGSLESVLQNLTARLEENCGSLVDRLVGFVDPLLSGVLMVTVGLSLISVMLPLIGMMNSVG